MIVKLKENIVLREELSGGKCFDRTNGNIIEIDKELFLLLHKMRQLELLDIKMEPKDKKVKQCIQKLLKLGVIEELPIGLLNHHYLEKEA